MKKIIFVLVMLVLLSVSCATKAPVVAPTEVPVVAPTLVPTLVPPDDGVTVSQKQAVEKAESYISIMAFSKEGLITQLKFEGFSEEDAVYGAENCEADWMEQASLKAKSYLEVMSFSRSGLITQLEFDGFTSEQAICGVDSVGL